MRLPRVRGAWWRRFGISFAETLAAVSIRFSVCRRSLRDLDSRWRLNRIVELPPATRFRCLRGLFLRRRDGVAVGRHPVGSSAMDHDRFTI